MAEIVPEMPNQYRRHASIRDWSQYATGDTWKFVEGTDFTGKPKNFAWSARMWAYRHGYDITVRNLPGEIYLRMILKSVTPDRPHEGTATNGE